MRAMDQVRMSSFRSFVRGEDVSKVVLTFGFCVGRER